MSRFAYVDGRFVPHGDAAIHIEDRSVQFADAVYEVWGVHDGRLLDHEGHIARLTRSLGELRIARPMTRAALESMLFELVRRNRVVHGLIYLQVSRGRARRDHAFPGPAVRPTVIATAKRLDPHKADLRAQNGIAVAVLPDERWGRCDIKTVSLLPNILAKQAAKEAGAQEAWLVDRDGFVTEGASSNAWIVTPEGALVTRQTSPAILGGITRQTVIDVARELGLSLEERPFTVEEAHAAREAFVTSASAFVTPVVMLDKRPVANGHSGEVAGRLRDAYMSASRAAAHKKSRRSPVRAVAPRAKRRVSLND
mgnify:FL=1